ncbi:Zinc finger BED domain-containing protein 5 [Trichinella patagoniensis]|uniref:Zinc finger BED domain-containing protein 5 n=1 Tax=Trichinella patagoniensis TaxID=990121 RepID=A0A0V0Z4Z0_9BILA|nr:Zinc finger BED domain-containing protein 5 [Trichinella patagoniensis]
MCLTERSRRSLSRRAQYASALCRRFPLSVKFSLGMDEWLIRKPVKREVAEMESQKVPLQLSNRRKVTRKYDIDYFKFKFTWNGDHKDPRPLCVICYEILADESMRPNKLLRNIETKWITKASRFNFLKAN